MSLTYDELLSAVAGDGVGLRARTALEPLGGPGDKVFPPTYSVEGTAQYAVETRRVDGASVECVVLDSVASQANRAELALLDAHRRGELRLPLISVDFSEADGVAGLDRISSLEAPHRAFDAIIRDSLLGERLFRLSDVGQTVTEATPRNAGAIFRHAPHTLVFGGWDSTGPRGGLGAKYERALTSEIVAIGIEAGKKTSSRIDPLGIERASGVVYASTEDGRTWTLDPSQATKDKHGEPVKKGKAEKVGRPSAVVHGNITPSVDGQTGGITADEIQATSVLSLIQLRRLRFPIATDGTRLEGRPRQEAEDAARAALAALGLAAVVLAFDDGLDLRSRCVLTATEDLSFELVRRGGAEPRSFSLTRDDALALLDASRSGAADAGMVWEPEELLLRPLDDLVTLVLNSQDIVAKGDEE